MASSLPQVDVDRDDTSLDLDARAFQSAIDRHLDHQASSQREAVVELKKIISKFNDKFHSRGRNRKPSRAYQSGFALWAIENLGLNRLHYCIKAAYPQKLDNRCAKLLEKIIELNHDKTLTSIWDVYLFFGRFIASTAHGLRSLERALRAAAQQDDNPPLEQHSSLDPVCEVYLEAIRQHQNRSKVPARAYAGVGILDDELERPFKAVVLNEAAKIFEDRNGRQVNMDDNAHNGTEDNNSAGDPSHDESKQDSDRSEEESQSGDEVENGRGYRDPQGLSNGAYASLSDWTNNDSIPADLETTLPQLEGGRLVPSPSNSPPNRNSFKIKPLGLSDDTYNSFHVSQPSDDTYNSLHVSQIEFAESSEPPRNQPPKPIGLLDTPRNQKGNFEKHGEEIRKTKSLVSLSALSSEHKRKSTAFDTFKGKERDGQDGDTGEPQPKNRRIKTTEQTHQKTALAPTQPAVGRQELGLGRGNQHELGGSNDMNFTLEQQWSAVEHLAPKTFLNDDAINISLQQLTYPTCSNCGDDGKNDIIKPHYLIEVLTSWESSSIVKHSTDEKYMTSLYNQFLRTRWRKALNPEEHEPQHLLIPVHIEERSHWVLYHWDPSTNRLDFYDSFVCQREDKILSPYTASLLKFLALFRPHHLGQPATRIVTTAQQTNGYDCGLYIIAKAHTIYRELRKLVDGGRYCDWQDETLDPLCSEKMRIFLALRILTCARVSPLSMADWLRSENVDWDVLITGKRSVSDASSITPAMTNHISEIATFQMPQGYTPILQAYQKDMQVRAEATKAAENLASAHAKHVRMSRQLKEAFIAQEQNKTRKEALGHFENNIPYIADLAARLDTTSRQQPGQSEGTTDTIEIHSDDEVEIGTQSVLTKLQLANIPPQRRELYMRVASTARESLLALNMVISSFSEGEEDTAIYDLDNLRDLKKEALENIHELARSYHQAMLACKEQGA